jgi:hypothetical protein
MSAPSPSTNEAPKPWRVEVSTNAVKSTPDEATLALRMGIAVTAIRAAHRLTICADDANGPAAMGERLWAFLLAVAYLHETKVTLQPHFPRVKELALEGGLSEADIRLVGQLFAGKTGLGKAMDRVRNELVFHFDEDAVRKWVAALDSDVVIWAVGSSPKVKDVLYRASADVVSATLAPEATNEDPTPLRRLIDEALPAMELVLSLMEHAMSAYVLRAGGRMVEEHD